ncbi:MAG: hypothetical protein K6E30_08625 [Lachnospiraceae bacterium]|nr:hypothetical protein [Lachnospiraceae bacterium]
MAKAKMTAEEAKAAAEIEVKKAARKASHAVADGVKKAVDTVAGDVKDVVEKEKLANEMTAGRVKAKVERVAAEEKAKAAAKKEAMKAPLKTVKAAKMTIVIQSPLGGEITPEEIAAKLPKGTLNAYVRIDQNKIYWVKKDETGSVDIW